MTSAFWGGFAGGVQKQRDQEYADAQEEKKMRLAEQLKAEYLAKIVDSDQTTYEGDFEVKRNSTGVEISRRQLAPDEIAARKMARDKDTAITEGAIATAGVAKKGLEYYDADRNAEQEDKRLGRELQRAGLDATRAGTSLAQQRFDYDKGQDTLAITRADEDAVNSTVSMIASVANDPAADSSVKSNLAALEVNLDRAKASGDPAAVRRVLAEIRGQIEMAYLKAKTAATATSDYPPAPLAPR